MDSPERLATHTIVIAPPFPGKSRQSEHNTLVPWIRLDRRHGIDQRVHLRMPWLAEVDYTIEGSAFRDSILDIGAGGAFIQSSRPWPVGQEIDLLFSLFVHHAPDKLIGEVVWRGREGIGVKFKSILRCVL